MGGSEDRGVFKERRDKPWHPRLCQWSENGVLGLVGGSDDRGVFKER